MPFPICIDSHFPPSSKDQIAPCAHLKTNAKQSLTTPSSHPKSSLSLLLALIMRVWSHRINGQTLLPLNHLKSNLSPFSVDSDKELTTKRFLIPLRVLVIGIAALVFFPGCKREDKADAHDTPSSSTSSHIKLGTAAGPCGEFNCLHALALDPTKNLGAEYKVEFNFSPTNCRGNCRCDRIAYVQIARVVLKDGMFWDDGNHAHIMVSDVKSENGRDDGELNGWFIDNYLDSKYGYYGKHSNGEFNREVIGPGQNKQTPEVPAWLFDRPLGLPKDSLVEFIDTPVCLDANASCSDKLLGYSHWWFIIESNGDQIRVEKPAFDLKPDDEKLTILKRAVQLAMAQWNDNAPSNGRSIEKFPSTMVTLQ